MRYLEQFPDFAELPSIPDYWQDISWRNEACPCWQISPSACVYVDYADPSVREYPNASRFTIIPMRDGQHIPDNAPILETDLWADVIAWAYTDLVGYDPFADDPAAKLHDVTATLEQFAALHFPK